jgi:hypothetical protein
MNEARSDERNSNRALSGQRRLDEPWADGIHPDPARGVFDGRCLGESDDAMLGSGVPSGVDQAHLAGNGRHVHDDAAT